VKYVLCPYSNDAYVNGVDRISAAVRLPGSRRRRILMALSLLLKAFYCVGPGAPESDTFRRSADSIGYASLIVTHRNNGHTIYATVAPRVLAAVTMAMANLAKALLGALWPLVALVAELSYCLHKPLNISNVESQLRRSCNNGKCMSTQRRAIFPDAMQMTMNCPLVLTRTVQPVITCRQSPYVHKPAIVKLLLLIYGFKFRPAFLY